MRLASDVAGGRVGGGERSETKKERKKEEGGKRSRERKREGGESNGRKEEMWGEEEEKKGGGGLDGHRNWSVSRHRAQCAVVQSDCPEKNMLSGSLDPDEAEQSTVSPEPRVSQGAGPFGTFAAVKA